MSMTNATANEKVVRDGYAIAERQEAEAFIAHFTPDGMFRNKSTGQEFRGRDVALWQLGVLPDRKGSPTTA
jgi:hypothetical protein